jgi:MFS family permease
LILIQVLYREIASDRSASGSNSSHRRLSLRQAVAFPSFGAMVAVMFAVSFVERSFGPVVPLYILQLGTGVNNAAKTAGLIISLGLLAEAVSATIMGKRLKTASARKLLLWRLGGGVLAALPMGFLWATSQLMILRLSLGLLAGGCMVVVYTLASRIIPAETRATSFGFLSSSALIGGAAGPVVAGALTHINIRAIFFFNGCLYLALLMVAWKSVRDAQ